MEKLEIKLSDLMDEVAREISSLDPEIAEEEDRRNKLQEVLSNLDESHTSLLEYQKLTNLEIA